MPACAKNATFKKSRGHLRAPIGDRSRWIAEQRQHHPVRALCAALDVAASGFYAWLNRPASARTMADQQHLTALAALQTASGHRFRRGGTHYVVGWRYHHGGHR